MMYHPPVAADFGDPECLDVQSALRSFLGKGQAEAYELFAGNGRVNNSAYAEDLGGMGPVAFEFYLEPAARYVESRHATGDIEFVSFLLTAIENHVRGEELTPHARAIVARLVALVSRELPRFVPADDDAEHWSIDEKLNELRRLAGSECS